MKMIGYYNEVRYINILKQKKSRSVSLVAINNYVTKKLGKIFLVLVWYNESH